MKTPPLGSLTLLPNSRDYGRAWLIRIWIWNQMQLPKATGGNITSDLTQSIYDFAK